MDRHYLRLHAKSVTWETKMGAKSYQSKKSPATVRAELASETAGRQIFAK